MPASNPLLPDQELPAPQAGGSNASWDGRDAAANLIRQKVVDAFREEPDAKEEIQEIQENPAESLSKHQLFLSELRASGASVIETQTKWHEYYTNLPEDEKHEVWHEFYAGQNDHMNQRSVKLATNESPQPKLIVNPGPAAMPLIATPSARGKRIRDARSPKEIRDSIRRTVSADGALKTKHHLQSLFVGLSAGALTLMILLFGLFNEMVIAPFIQPSRSVSATPIIVDNAGLAADGQSKIIIPKINVEIPVGYDVASMAEADIQAGLESGVVHYPSTVQPGEQGNAAYFGHSSNNIFNPGEYKFAFVLLSKLENGDMFYLTKNSQTYAYRIFQKQIVNPGDTWVLGSVEGKTATAALITCDPPGTTRYRLVVWGEQISPSATTAVAPSVPQALSQAANASLPGQAPSLWSRFVDWMF